MRQCNLYYHHDPPRNQNYYPPDITEDSIDILSSQLQIFSQRLERLEINGTVLSPELFWQSSGPDDTLTKPPLRPDLTDVLVNHMGITPSGEWLLDRDPEESDFNDESDGGLSDEDNLPEYVRIPMQDHTSKFFRTRIIAGLIDRYYAAAGRAALRMPKLRRIEIQYDVYSIYSFQYEVRAGTAKLTWKNVNRSCVPVGTDIVARRKTLKSKYQPGKQVFKI